MTMNARLEKRVLALCHNLLLANSHKDFIHFTLIANRNKIISVGRNDYCTHPMAAKHGYEFPMIHSELDAIRKVADKDCLTRATLINVRLSKIGVMRMAKPCVDCQNLLNYFGIRRIIYSTNEGFVDVR